MQEAEKALVRQVQEQVQDVGTGLGGDRPVSQRTDDAETHEKGSRDALSARARHHTTVRQPLATDWPMVALKAVRLLDVDGRRNSRNRGQRSTKRSTKRRQFAGADPWSLRGTHAAHDSDWAAAHDQDAAKAPVPDGAVCPDGIADRRWDNLRDASADSR